MTEEIKSPPEPPKKKKRGCRGCLGVGLFLFLFLAGAVVIAPWLIPTETLRKEVIAKVEAGTGRTCALESVSFGWWDGLALEGFRLDDPNSTEKPLLKANRLYLDVDLGSVIRGSPIVRKILVSGAHISIYKRADGSRSYEDLFASSPNSTAEKKEALLSSAAETSQGGKMSFQVKQIGINESSFSYRDEDINKEILIPDMIINGGDINGPMQISGSVALNGGGGITVNGTLDLLENNALDQNGSGNLELSAQKLDVAKLCAGLGVGGMVKAGLIEGPVSLKLIKLQPQILTSGLQVRGLTLTATATPVVIPEMTVNLTGNYDTGSGTISAEKLSVTSGFLSIAGGGNHDGTSGKFTIASGSVDTAKMMNWLVQQKLAEPQKISGTAELKAGVVEILPAGVLNATLTMGKAPLMFLLSDGPASMDLTNQKVQISARSPGIAITADLLNAPTSVPVPDCKQQAKLLLTGRCDVRVTGTATEIVAQLVKSAADIPETMYAKAAKLTVSGKAVYLLKSDSLEIDTLMLQGPGINLSGRVALTNVSAKMPQISDLSVSAGMQLATLTEQLKLPPEWKDYSAAGPLTAQLKMIPVKNGYGIAAKLNSENMKLRKTEKETLREANLGVTAINLNGVVDPSSGDLTVDQGSLVCTFLSAAIKGRIGSKTALGYNLTAAPDKEVMALLGVPSGDRSTTPLQLRESRFTGQFVYEAGKLTFTRTMIDGGVSLGAVTYNVSGAHDLSLDFSKKDLFDLSVSKLNLTAASTGAPLVASSDAGTLHIASDKVSGTMNISVRGPAAPAHAILTGLSPFIPALQELKLAEYHTGGTLMLTGVLNANDQKVTLDLAGNITDGSISRGDKNLYKDSQSSLNLKGQYNPKEKALAVSRLLLISQSGQASFSLNQLSAKQIGKSWKIENGNVVMKAVDLSKLPSVCPMLIPAGTKAQGRVSSSFSVAGPLSALKLGDGVADFVDFYYRSEADASPIAMKKSRADFSGILNLEKPEEKPSKAPYAYMRDFDIANAVLKLDQVTVDTQSLSDVMATMTMKDGRLVITQGITKFGVDGLVSIAGGIDFNPEKPICTIHTRIAGASLATIMSLLVDMTEIGVINSGLASLSNPETGQPVKVSWRGLVSDDIHTTLKAEDGAFLLTDVEFASGKQTGLIGFLLDKIGNTKGEEILGMKDEKKTFQFKSIAGHLTAERGFIDISQIRMIGTNTADFEVKGQIKPDGKVDFRVYVISNVQRFIRPDNIVQKMPKVGDLDKEKLRKDIRAAMEKLGNAKKLSFKIEGTLKRPMPTGLDSMFGVVVQEVLKIAGKDFLESKGKDLLKNIFK